MRKLATFAALAALIPLTACTKGGAKKEEKKAEVQTAPKPAMDPFWEKGELPPSVTEGAAQPGGTVTIWLPQEPNHLVGLIEPDWWLARMTEGHIFEALVYTDVE